MGTAPAERGRGTRLEVRGTRRLRQSWSPRRHTQTSTGRRSASRARQPGWRRAQQQQAAHTTPGRARAGAESRWMKMEVEGCAGGRAGTAAPIPTQNTDSAWPEDSAARQLSGGRRGFLFTLTTVPLHPGQHSPVPGQGTSPGPQLTNFWSEGVSQPPLQREKPLPGLRDCSPPGPAPPPRHRCASAIAAVSDMLPPWDEHPGCAARGQHG